MRVRVRAYARTLGIYRVNLQFFCFFDKKWLEKKAFDGRYIYIIKNERKITMPRNRFDGSEAPDYPKGNGKMVCMYIDQACIDMLKQISAIKSMTASQVVRELIRQE